MDEAISRLKIAADAGADVCFIEGVKTKQLLERTVDALAPKPVRYAQGSSSKHPKAYPRFSSTLSPVA
jgi:2-methylisocitrate lyase-like PEP mutase family enzyme